jgi:hypothetical protein
VAKTSIRTQDLAAHAVTGSKLGVQTAKGDLIAHNGTDAIAVAVGSNGQVLQADSTAAGGVSWVPAVLAGNVVESEVPAGTIDGTNATFNLANTPVTGSLKLYKNGMRQQAGTGNDYTLATAAITFLAGNVPQVGDVLLADYRK